jgi:hypothetical protein
MATIGTSRLKIVNDQPSIDKLENGRYRLEFFCSNDGKKTDWYADNIDLIFPAFGALQSDAFAAGTWVAPSGSVYSDMRLVEAGTQYVPAANQHYVKLVYETITASYAQIKDDTVDYELNGLRSVSRTLVALPDAAYANTVGTSTIDSDGITLYLSSFKIEKTDAKWLLTEVWIQSGVIAVSTNKDSIADEIVVDAINFNATQVRSAVSEVTVNHNLKSQSTRDFEGLKSFRYVFEIRSTTTETELGDPLIGVEFETGIQTDGSSDFIITREYAISSANTASSIKQLLPPSITDPVFDGTGGTQKAYIVDQEVKPNGLEGATLKRTFAMVPSKVDEWDEMVVRFPGVDRGPFQLDEGFAFRSEPYSEAVPVRICRDFYLSNPQRICLPSEFRPVDNSGNRVDVLTQDTVPTADEYIGYVNSGKYLNDRVSILRWQGDIWERRITQFKAE